MQLSVVTPVSMLQTLEACVKNCGRRFQQEVGKFRFLNELIKVISPKVSSLHLILDHYVVAIYWWSALLQVNDNIH